MQKEQTKHNDIICPLLTDLYQLSMGYAYFNNKRHEEKAVFEVTFRECAFGGQYTIWAGLKEVLLFIDNYKFTDEHIEYLKQIMPSYIQPEFWVYLKNLDCSKLKITALPEGSVVFPRIPLMKIEGPLLLVQLLETPILTLCSFPSLLTTNAARLVKEVGPGKTCLEFGCRRAQASDGALSASQYSYLGGFFGSSNVIAGLKFGMPIIGTMAHSYVSSYNSLNDIKDVTINGHNIIKLALQYRKQLGYEHTNDSELASFLSFAKAYPNNFKAIVDTYDTLNSGVPNFLLVAFALMDAGTQNKELGIRLDSGDLAYLSVKSRALFKDAGQKAGKNVDNMTITVSNKINEETLQKMNARGHEIDSYGIGTHLVTCQKQPALGLIYKLVSIENQAKMKLSEQVEKETLPGKKSLYRIWVKGDQYPKADIIALENEKVEVDKEILCADLNHLQERYKITPQKVINIINEYYINGKMVKKPEDLKDARSYCIEQQALFDPEITANKNPKCYLVLMTMNYYKFYQETKEKILVFKKM